MREKQKRSLADLGDQASSLSNPWVVARNESGHLSDFTETHGPCCHCGDEARVVGFRFHARAEAVLVLVCQVVAVEAEFSYSSWRRSQRTAQSPSLRPIGVRSSRA
jgi:hypothetical protein